MYDWLLNNEALLWWLAVVSAITFILSVIIVPIILIRLPADYFSRNRNSRAPCASAHPLIKFPLLILKNSFAVILIIAGIAMLALPGQGILTIVAGIVLLDFPGKHQAERWIIERKYILHAINWVRTKAGKSELLM